MPEKIEYQCIGHVCHDITPLGSILGGTASYASIVAQRLGMTTEVITSCGDDFLFDDVFRDRGILLKKQLSKETTKFQNIYRDGTREQFMHARADTIHSSSWGPRPPELKAIQLCLIADEVDLELLATLPQDVIIAATIQGWLRSIDDDHRVITKYPDLELFKYIQLAFMSDDDIREVPTLLDHLKEIVPIVVVTRGSKGADVYLRGQHYFYHAYPSQEIDPTGAGDVFSTAFIISYSHNPDIYRSCSFAHCAASLSIEGVGVGSIPTREAVFKRQEHYVSLFPAIAMPTNHF